MRANGNVKRRQPITFLLYLGMGMFIMRMMMKAPIQVISLTTETFAHFKPVINTIYTAYILLCHKKT